MWIHQGGWLFPLLVTFIGALHQILPSSMLLHIRPKTQGKVSCSKRCFDFVLFTCDRHCRFLYSSHNPQGCSIANYTKSLIGLTTPQWCFYFQKYEYSSSMANAPCTVLASARSRDLGCMQDSCSRLNITGYPRCSTEWRKGRTCGVFHLCYSNWGWAAAICYLVLEFSLLAMRAGGQGPRCSLWTSLALPFLCSAKGSMAILVQMGID